MVIEELPDLTITVGGTGGDAQHQEKVATPPRYTSYDAQTNTVTLMSSRDSLTSLAEDERKFRALAERWYVDTMPLSSYLEKIMHPAYQKILTLDKAAVPFILRELEDMPNDWFWALRVITDEDPVREEDAGDLEKMAASWLNWGRERGII